MESIITLLSLGAGTLFFGRRLSTVRRINATRRILGRFLSLSAVDQNTVLTRCGETTSASEEVRIRNFDAFVLNSWQEMKQANEDDLVAFEEQFTRFLDSAKN